MKKINAFYCIKTPSDWKESVLMYDKPTEKNKTKLTDITRLFAKTEKYPRIFKNGAELGFKCSQVGTKHERARY